MWSGACDVGLTILQQTLGQRIDQRCQKYKMFNEKKKNTQQLIYEKQHMTHMESRRADVQQEAFSLTYTCLFLADFKQATSG